MFNYIFSALFCWFSWRSVRFFMRWNAERLRYNGIPIISEDHWFWGFTKTVKTLDDLMNVCVEDMERGQGRDWFQTRMTIFMRTLYPTSPNVIRDILQAKNLPKATNFAGAYRMLKPWIGDGLLISYGHKWERNRRLLTPAFHFDILKPYVEVMHSVADIFQEKIEKQTKTGGSIDIYPRVCLATLDTMLRCTVSYNDVTIQDSENHHPYAMAIRRLINLLTERALSPIMCVDMIYNLSSDGKEFKRLSEYTHTFTTSLIKTRRQSLESDPSQLEKRHLDFLDILITARDEHGEGLSDLDIRDEVDTFVFEGHDTTASAINWTIYSMAKYPEMQTKIRMEVQGLLNGRNHIAAEDLPNLPYTTCFIKECLRMYSPVPVTARDLVEPLTINGSSFMPGDHLCVIPYLVHHNPDVWDNHMEFRPERFLPDNCEGRHPFAFIPFSAGQRNCIGQHFAMNEIKVMITRLVMRFNIRLDASKEAIPYKEVVTRAKDGIYLYFDEIPG